jgi:phosphate transport system permease protein
MDTERVSNPAPEDQQRHHLSEEPAASPILAATYSGIDITREPEALKVLRATPTGEVRACKREPHPAPRTFNIGDRIFGAVTAGFAGLILVILGAILLVLGWQARDSITKFGLGFVTSTTWNVNLDAYGAAPAILGTIYTSLLALALAAPIGVMIAMFLTEIAPRRLAFPFGFLVELLAAVPSIVFGFWALVVLVPLVRDTIQPPLIDHLGSAPFFSNFFSGYPLGLGVFTAALILAIMVLPTITSISRDVMLAVPNSQRDAMLALGATKWEMTRKAVIPYARSGIVGAVMLALGRAVGETMAVQLVIGNTQAINLSVFNTGTTMPATIVTQFLEATSHLQTSALIEIALILMLVTLFLNAIARLFVWRMTGPQT